MIENISIRAFGATACLGVEFSSDEAIRLCQRYDHTLAGLPAASE